MARNRTSHWQRRKLNRQKKKAHSEDCAFHLPQLVLTWFGTLISTVIWTDLLLVNSYFKWGKAYVALFRRSTNITADKVGTPTTIRSVQQNPIIIFVTIRTSENIFAQLLKSRLYQLYRKSMVLSTMLLNMRYFLIIPLSGISKVWSLESPRTRSLEPLSPSKLLEEHLYLGTASGFHQLNM